MGGSHNLLNDIRLLETKEMKNLYIIFPYYI